MADLVVETEGALVVNNDRAVVLEVPGASFGDSMLQTNLESTLLLICGPEDMIYRRRGYSDVEGLCELQVAAAIFLGRKDLLFGSYSEEKDGGAVVEASLLDLAVRFGLFGLAAELARLGVPLHRGLSADPSNSDAKITDSGSIERWSAMAPKDMYDLKIAYCDKMSPRSRGSVSENGGSPSSSQRRNSQLSKYEDSVEGRPNSARRGSFGEAHRGGGFRSTTVDSERGLLGAMGRWTAGDAKDAAVRENRLVKGKQKNPVRGLVLRVGHLMHPPQELDAFADILEQRGFETRESLAMLNESMAIDVGIPPKLAIALQYEVTTNRLQRRYSGKVQPLEEIVATMENDKSQLQPCQETNYSRHNQIQGASKNSKEKQSAVCRQILRVGHRLYAPWELHKFAEILEDNDYITRDALQRLTDAEAVRMRVPLKLAAALRGAGRETSSVKALHDRSKFDKPESIQAIKDKRRSPAAPKKAAGKSSPRGPPQRSAPQRDAHLSPRGAPQQQRQARVVTAQDAPGMGASMSSPHMFNQNFLPQPLVPHQPFNPNTQNYSVAPPQPQRMYSGGTMNSMSAGTISNVVMPQGTVSGMSGGTMSGMSGGTMSGMSGGTMSSMMMPGTMSGMSGGTMSLSGVPQALTPGVPGYGTPGAPMYGAGTLTPRQPAGAWPSPRGTFR